MGCANWLVAIVAIALILVWLGCGSFVLGVLVGAVLLFVLLYKAWE